MNIKRYLHLIAFFIFLHTYSQSTNADMTFGIAGKANFSFGPNDSQLTNIALQPDGKIIACGRYYYLQPGDIMDDGALCRFNTNGTIDETFGVQGVIMLPGGPYSEFISTDMKILEDGKILVLGYTLTYDNPNANSETILLKYNPDGTPDVVFGTNGFLQVNSGLGNNLGNVLLVQSDNKIIIGGNMEDDGYNFAIFRLNSDGTKDSTFGTNGLVSINLGTSQNNADISSDSITDIQLLANGKMIVGGTTKKNFAHNHDSMFALISLNHDGSLDTGFGINGRVFTNFESFGDELQGLHVLDDGKIIAVGTDFSENLLSKKIIIAKYNPDGSLDTGYGQSGKVSFTNDISNPRFSALSSLINAHGELIVGGTGNTIPLSSFQKPILMRFTPDGLADESFAPQGIYTENASLYPANILYQPDGKLLLAGSIFNDMNSREFAVFRYEGTALASENFLNATDLSVYPVPFDHYVDVNFNLAHEGIVTITVCDMMGRNVNSPIKNQTFFSGENTVRIDFKQTLPHGVYFVMVTDGTTGTTFKIIK